MDAPHAVMFSSWIVGGDKCAIYCRHGFSWAEVMSLVAWIGDFESAKDKLFLYVPEGFGVVWCD